MIRQKRVPLHVKIAIRRDDGNDLNKIIYPQCNLQHEISTFNTL